MREAVVIFMSPMQSIMFGSTLCYRIANARVEFWLHRLSFHPIRHAKVSATLRGVSNANQLHSHAAIITRHASGSTRTRWKKVSSAIQEKVNDGELLYDPLQQQAAKKLTKLQSAIESYNHDLFKEQLRSLEDYHERKQSQEQKQQLDDEKSRSNNEDVTSVEEPPSMTELIPRGYYIYGQVGTGKSMILNSFFEHAPTSKKKRLHFHSFLQDIHQRIHILNKQLLDEHGRSFHVDTAKSRNPILQIAKQVSEEVTLLCIDEFQVTDIADAMILAQFFGELWRLGTIVAATSNRPPDALYEGGLNRDYFLPFIDLLKKYCVIHHLTDKSEGNEEKSSIDYRRVRSGVITEQSNEHGKYFFLTNNEQNGENASEELDTLFLHYQEKYPIKSSEESLQLQVNFKRIIPIHRSHSDVIARFSFNELCTTELGSSDYNAIAKHFRIVMLENIPQLNLKYPDRARRFITLIDELYEAECCLVCSAADVPDRLFTGDQSEETESNGSNDNSDKIDGTMLAVDVAQSQGTALSSLASVKELSFAFQRATSRILEMSSSRWWEERL